VPRDQFPLLRMKNEDVDLTIGPSAGRYTVWIIVIVMLSVLLYARVIDARGLAAALKSAAWLR
jgi:hypothetical protein